LYPDPEEGVEIDLILKETGIASKEMMYCHIHIREDIACPNTKGEFIKEWMKLLFRIGILIETNLTSSLLW
jgi:hypothetical protein